MAISSPNVVKRDQPDLLQMGMQIGQQVQMQKMQRANQAMNIFKTLDDIAKDPSTAGGWNALLKRPGVQDALKGAYKDLGVSEKVADEFIANLGSLMPSPIASMEMTQAAETYLAKGESLPPQFFQSFNAAPGGGGTQGAPPEPSGQEITGTTYQWKDTGTTPGTQGPVTPQEQGTPEQLRSAGETLNAATTEFDRQLQQFGWTPDKGPSKEELIKSGNVPEGLKPSLEKLKTAQQQMDTLMGNASVDITSGAETNSPQQQKNIVDGNWVVKEKDTVVGKIENGVFRPNDQYKWTNESEMLKGMSSQVWGKEKGDVEAFKEMLYSQAKEAGYKGSKEKFFYAKPNKAGMGRASSHGAWMPEWYDWARENGIKIKQPSETPTSEMLKYTGATGQAKAKAIEKTEDNIRKVISPEGLETTYTAQAFPESGAGGAVTKEERVPGYLTFEEAKKNEKFLKQHLGHYGDLLFKDKKTYNQMMLHQKRIYNNLGGEGILQTLAPNKIELEKSKLGAMIDQELNRMFMASEELKAQIGWKAEDLELREKELNLQERIANADMGLKWNLAQQKAGEQSNDVTQQLFEEGYKTMTLFKDKLEGASKEDVINMYKENPVFRYGYTQLLMASAIRSGIDPRKMIDALDFQMKDPSKFLWWDWPWSKAQEEGIPVVGATEQISPETQAERDLKEQSAEAEKQNQEDIDAIAASGLYD